MDYEKKYNDALERARALWREAIEKEYVEDYLKDYETIFPELRESEDERIRRTLVEYFGPKVQLDFVRGIPIQKIRDWLEKQKEQKQTDLPAGFYYIDLNGNRYYSKEFRYGDMKLKVGEQKPVLTAKETWKEMRLEVYAQASGNRHEPNYSDDSTKMFSLCDIDEIFEKIGNSTVEQKPAWSEDIIRKAVKEIGLTQHQIDWFKTNVFPPKQEWSEEDSKRYISIGTTLGTSVVLSKEDYDANMAWLRELVNAKKYSSPCPSWKPSEEQMEALNAMNCCGELSYQGQQQLLIDLYQQLKKLM